MKTIKLTKGYEAIVDNEDYDELMKYKWSISISKSSGPYASNDTVGLMHRLIMKAKPHEFVDHTYHNTLDNRKQNLRICTRSQNGANRKGKNKCQKT